MNSRFSFHLSQALEIARAQVHNKLSSIPEDDIDLVDSGVLDSMAWVDTLVGIESATGLRDFGNTWPEGRPRSIRTLAEMIEEAQTDDPATRRAPYPAGPGPTEHNVSVAGFAYVLGSRVVGAERIERDLGLPAQKIREGAGIHTVCLASESETEVALAQKASESALEMAEVAIEDIDLIVATSATFVGFPSFAAALHSRLLLPETSAALDVGGACAGLIHAFAVAKGQVCATSMGSVLVVAAEVHSRRLNSPGAPGEFRGLFGDGACAFVLKNSAPSAPGNKLSLGEFVGGCSAAAASSLGVNLSAQGELRVDFRGEQLARAAISQLARIIAELERLSGKPRSQVDFFALHQPNPRVIEILADQAGIPLGKIPLISKTSGNLGSVTCGVSLCHALAELDADAVPAEAPLIFMAAVGPGLVWAGTCLTTARTPQAFP